MKKIRDNIVCLQFKLFSFWLKTIKQTPP